MTDYLVEPSTTTAMTAVEALGNAEADLRAGGGLARAWATGFTPLDAHLGGGLHAGDLALLAGAEGTGKTTFALQMARNVCEAGGEAVYICYEHAPALLAGKLVVMEAALVAGASAASQEEVRRCLSRGGDSLGSALDGLPGAAEGLARLGDYGSRLDLVGARGDVTGIADIKALAERTTGPALVVVDYLQKVYAGDVQDEEVRVSRIATSLKDLALQLDCPVLAVAAVDRHGLDAKRIRSRHLKGSVTLAYEADVVLVLQDKYDIVARQHLVYDLSAAEEHHRWLVCTVEKNRHGRDHGELEFRKRLSQCHFEPRGRVVEHDLLDERIHLT